MNPWKTNPVWQNFCSLYRESVSSSEAKDDINRYHHSTAALYFGISCLEAFANQSKRASLLSGNTEDEILEVLRSTNFIKKIKKWPKECLGARVPMKSTSMEFIALANRVRGDLTHPKTNGQDVYSQLDEVSSFMMLNVVREYIVRYHELQKTRYPYWIFGWNYLNPPGQVAETILLNDEQFVHSMRSLGLSISGGGYGVEKQWLDTALGSYEHFCGLLEGLDKLEHCEPKAENFPMMPKLCSRFWDQVHRGTCGRPAKSS